ncbi:hypothetical protein [Allomuricauda sp. SCSIO 65647]|uniref:hypothetical protein n=1 Tax=Allomuricauda sp. SCSIO 65647 TaxID=2908843 RepID=UPI001F451A0C|nr:hypothetical protein [Muricauda sp. SCSIO 65647]UJH68222.1 hypothetical protein L0P89_03205 [Muricauda sp. SCSIO 65647]
MDKFEKHIKRKLQEREIKPSEAAWEKLEARLGPETSRPKRRYRWYAVAAVFVGVLFLSMFFFSSDGEQTTKEEIVDTAPEKPKVRESGTVHDEMEKGTETIAEGKRGREKQESIMDTKEVSRATIALAKGDSAKKTRNEPVDDGRSLIDEKLDEVMAQVTLLESQNRQVTEAEVDSLLRAAQREILTEKAIQRDGAVDAIALLNEVESELDQTFRDEIFDALKQGYFKLKTAVADRNN